MSSDEADKDYARLAARVLAERTPAPGVHAAIADRAGAIAAIDGALRARRGVRTMRRVWFPTAAAAVAIAAGVIALVVRATNVDPAATLTVTRIAGSPAALEAGGGAGVATVGEHLVPGARLRAPIGGELVAALENGTRVHFSSGAVARVAELGATVRFDVEAGTFSAEVAKLAADHRFLVMTPDADVEVRGTVFEVTVLANPLDCAAGGRTRVAVREGVVVVRRGTNESRVSAGESWPACPPRVETRPVAPAPEPAARRAVVRPAGPRLSEAVSPSPAPAASPSLASSLAEQNDLFAAALAARRRGDEGEALRWLDRLLARYPEGQLAGSARMERQRLLGATEALPAIPQPAAPKK